ncbi:F-box-like domain protein [Rhizoctonia solani 123E]|uniref:F-box-like domain protein n=1 Tax=Rhizoctonia solani 123E TaxID=1423351 RepID=A0A074S0E8_9AGAM|nr:F-box-like domain protein [Rhizoctonia solani 123E]
MPENNPIAELMGRLNSPTHGAPSSPLQLVAMQDIESLDRIRLNSDTLTQREVSILADTLEQLKLDTEVIRSIQQRIEIRTKNAQKFFQYATAVLAPINRFPAEVLSRIFVLGKGLELNFSPRMSWVAQRWRNVALSTPELWNTIPLTGVGRVTTYISRSGSMLLDIEADLRTYRINTFDISQCMKVLEPCRLRWHGVKVLLEDHDQAQPILRQLEDADFFRLLYAMPNLTELVLDQCSFIMPNFINDPTPIPLEKLALLQLSLIPDEVVNLVLTKIFAPNLRHFELIAHEMDGPSQILNWETIRAKYTGLVVLKLGAITSSAAHSLLQWLPELPKLTVLACCTELHTIEIGVIGLEGVAVLQRVLQSRSLLRSGKVTIIVDRDVKGKESENKDIVWMQSHLKKFRVRAGTDGDDETASDESDYE